MILKTIIAVDWFVLFWLEWYFTIFATMSDGNYISSSDMKEIDELYNSWWKESPYELKATVQ